MTLPNCDSYCEKAIRLALPVGTNNVNIKTRNQSIGSGTVIINEYGMLVLTNAGETNPSFVVTCKASVINEFVD